MLHIIIAPCNGDKAINIDSPQLLQELADNNKAILVEPDNKPTFLRENLIKPLLIDGFLPSAVFNDGTAVYHYEDDKYSFDYDFGYLPPRYNQIPIRDDGTGFARQLMGGI